MATIRKRNDLYQVQIRLKGLRPVSASFHTEKQAVKWAERKETELRLGIVEPSPQEIRQNGSYTLRDILLKFDEARELKNSYQCALRELLKDPISELRLTEITRHEAMLWRNRQQSRLKPQSVAKYARVPRGAWAFAVDVLGLKLPSNPFCKLGLKDVKSRRWRRLATGELERLLEGCNCFKKQDHGGVKPTDWKDIILFAIETGMRRGEIARIRIEDIREVGPGKTLWIGKTKTERPREIPLSRKAAAILEDRIERGFEPLLFPYQPKTITKDFVRLCRFVGIANLHFHDLRHEALSRLNELGLSTFELKLISGHKSTAYLDVYVNPELVNISARIWRKENESHA